jgi:hypothetical protein
MTNSLLTKSFRSASAIAGFLIVKAAAGGAAVASAGTDPLLGAAGSMGVPEGGMLDVDMVGASEVRLGGDVVAGDPLTSNAAGKAIKALPVANAVVRIIGFAMSDGAADDIIPYHIAPGTLTKPAAA